MFKLGGRALWPDFYLRLATSQGLSGKVRPDSARNLIYRPWAFLGGGSHPTKAHK